MVFVACKGAHRRFVCMTCGCEVNEHFLGVNESVVDPAPLRCADARGNRHAMHRFVMVIVSRGENAASEDAAA